MVKKYIVEETSKQRMTYSNIYRLIEAHDTDLEVRKNHYKKKKKHIRDLKLNRQKKENE